MNIFNDTNYPVFIAHRTDSQTGELTINGLYDDFIDEEDGTIANVDFVAVSPQHVAHIVPAYNGQGQRLESRAAVASGVPPVPLKGYTTVTYLQNERRRAALKHVEAILSKKGKTVYELCTPLNKATWGAYERGFMRCADWMLTGIIGAF